MRRPILDESDLLYPYIRRAVTTKITITMTTTTIMTTPTPAMTEFDSAEGTTVKVGVTVGVVSIEVLVATSETNKSV